MKPINRYFRALLVSAAVALVLSPLAATPYSLHAFGKMASAVGTVAHDVTDVAAKRIYGTNTAFDGLPDSLVPSPAVIADLHRVGIELPGPGEIGYSAFSHVAPATKSAATGRAYFTPNSQWSTTAQNLRLAAISTASASGFLDFYSGSQPANGNSSVTGTQLCSVALGATAWHTPSSGTMTISGPVTCTGTAGASTGTAAAYAILYESNHTTILWMGNVATSSANITMATTTMSTGLTVTIADAAITLTDNASISGQ